MDQQIPNTMTPGPQKQFQQNQPVVNPADGKSYNVVQQVPGKGITLQDPQTLQNVMVSEQDSQNLQPAIKTTADQALDSVLGKGSEKPKVFSMESIARSIVEDLTGTSLPDVVVTPKQEFKYRISKMKRNWMDIRKQIKTQHQINPVEASNQSPTDNEPRQITAFRDLKNGGYIKEASGYNPYEGDLIKEIGRDRKTGLPMRGGEKDDVVGLTEFPYGVDKDKNPEGYGKMTMEEMDRNFEETRPHFKNEQYLPDYTKKREESNTYLNRREKDKKIKDLRKDHNQPRYSTSEEEENTKEASIDRALDKAIGVYHVAEEVPGPERLPVQFKDVKKAPGKDMGYVEPSVLEQAGPDVKAAVEMFKETQGKIEDIKNQIAAKTKPLQDAILEATRDLNTDLAKNAALLKTALDMIYTELEKTDDKVAVINDEIFTALSREKAVAPPASLPQILKKAESINPQLAVEIGKIKALIEDENTKMVIEQFLYKYPVSEQQNKKIKAALEEGNLDQFLSEAFSIVNGLQALNAVM